MEIAAGGGEEAEAAQTQLERIAAYSGVTRAGVACDRLARILLTSPANLAFLTPQDLLDQGGDERMDLGRRVGSDRDRTAQRPRKSEAREHPELVGAGRHT